MDYNSFAEQCVEELKIVQDQFRRDYNLNCYENWFYNQSTGLLTLSTGAEELNFRYCDVGSFSEKSQTWKWSWDNESTLDSVKEQVNLVREFGETSSFPKLTNGYFPSDEIEAWELTAIAVKLCDGIGVYRPVGDDQLKIFLVITELVDNETAQKIKSRYIECGSHEYARAAFVCRHLSGTAKTGFNEAFETWEDMELLEDDDFQAWCDACEEVRQKEGEWNEKSMAFAEIKLVCERCYFEIKKVNEH